MRLVDADDLSESIRNGSGTPIQKFFADVCVAAANTVDAVPVVRCKNCIYKEKAEVNEKGYLICHASGMEITDKDFCSYGESVEKDG